MTHKFGVRDLLLILINRKSVYMKEWCDKGIWAVARFMNVDGSLLSHGDFFHLKLLLKLNNIIKALPTPLKSMITEDILHSKVSPHLRQLCLGVD